MFPSTPLREHGPWFVVYGPIPWSVVCRLSSAPPHPGTRKSSGPPGVLIPMSVVCRPSSALPHSGRADFKNDLKPETG